MSSTLVARYCYHGESLTGKDSPWHVQHRSAAEGRLALPKHELGLDVIVWASVPGALRRTVVDLKSLSTCTTVGWPSPADGHASARAL